MVELFYSQCLSRQLDRISRRLQARGEGFYTIGSSGHENNAAVAAGLAPRRHGLPPLPVERLPDPPRPSRSPGQTPCLGHAAELRRLGRGPDLRRPPQGDRIEAAVHPAADQHHRLASAQGGGRGVQHRHRQDAEARRQPAGRAIRSCSPASATPRPTIRPRRARSTPPAGPPIRARRCRSSSCARTMASASRRGRPGGWIEASFRDRPGLDYIALQRPRHGRRLSRRPRRRPLCPHPAQAGLPPHGYACGSTAMPAPTSRPAYLSKAADRGGRGARSPAATARRCWSSRDLLDRSRSSTSTTRPRRRSPGSPSRRSPGPSSPAAKAVMASLIPPPAPRPARANRPSPEEREALFARDLGHDGKAPAHGAAAELGARRSDARAWQHHRRRRGCRAQGRRLQRHRQAARTVRLGPGDQHPARRAEHPRPRHRRRP